MELDFDSSELDDAPDNPGVKGGEAWGHRDDDSGGLVHSEFFERIFGPAIPSSSASMLSDGSGLGESTDGEDWSSLGVDREAEMEHWHLQNHDDTCAVVGQEFVLESVTGLDYSEENLREEALSRGWYAPGCGTPLAHVGNLLEIHGVEVDRRFGCSIDEMAERLAEGQKVLVSIDADEIWSAGQGFLQDDFLGDLPQMPGQDANHVVQVIDVDRSDPDHPVVILNDSGNPQGCGLRVALKEFEDAWADSSNFMVATTGRLYGDAELAVQAADPWPALPAAPMPTVAFGFDPRPAQPWAMAGGGRLWRS